MSLRGYNQSENPTATLSRIMWLGGGGLSLIPRTPGLISPQVPPILERGSANSCFGNPNRCRSKLASTMSTSPTQATAAPGSRCQLECQGGYREFWQYVCYCSRDGVIRCDRSMQPEKRNVGVRCRHNCRCFDTTRRFSETIRLDRSSPDTARPRSKLASALWF